MAHANTFKSQPKPYFTNYLSACYTEKSLAMRAAYDYYRRTLDMKRSLNVRVPRSKTENVRCGFPIKRDGRPTDQLSKRGMAYSHFTKCYKTVGVLLQVPPYYIVKTFILHATRGWKAFT